MAMLKTSIAQQQKNNKKRDINGTKTPQMPQVIYLHSNNNNKDIYGTKTPQTPQVI